MIKPFAPRSLITIIPALALAACGSSNETPADNTSSDAAIQSDVAANVAVEGPMSEVEQVANARPASFGQCVACHADTADQPSGIGPNLVGVFGKPAGSREDYSYSAAMMYSGLTWDAETLDAYIASPQRVVSGTKMSFGGVADEAKRKELVEYLAGLN